MIRVLLSIFFMILGIIIDRFLQIGIIWLFVGGLLSLISIYRIKSKDIVTKSILVISISEIICGIITFITGI